MHSSSPRTVVFASIVVAHIFSAAASKGDQCAYVTGTAPSGSISAINVATNQVAATIAAHTDGEIAIAADGKTAYVATGADAVLVIDTAAKAVTATIPVGHTPSRIALSPNGRDLYVANRGDDSVTVIDATRQTVVATIGLPDHEDLVTDISFVGPRTVAVSPDGLRVYVTRDYRDENLESEILTYEAGTNVIIERSGSLEENMHRIAVTRDGSVLYATLAGGASDSPWYTSLGVFDSATGTLRRRIPVVDNQDQESPVRIGDVAIAADGQVYVANTSFDSVAVIDPAAAAVIVQIPVGQRPEGIAVTPDGKAVYVANSGSGTVSVISTATHAVADTITVGGGPHSIVIVSASCPKPALAAASSGGGGCSIASVRQASAADALLFVSPALLLCLYVRRMRKLSSVDGGLSTVPLRFR